MCDGYNVPGIVEIEMEKSLTSYQVVHGCLLCPGFRERNMQSHPVFHQRLCSGIQSLDHTFLGKKVAGKTVFSLCHLKYHTTPFHLALLCDGLVPFRKFAFKEVLRTSSTWFPPSFHLPISGQPLMNQTCFITTDCKFSGNPQIVTSTPVAAADASAHFFIFHHISTSIHHQTFPLHKYKR